jgi:polyphosphate kinase
MAIKHKSHNLNEALLRRAQRSLGTATETDTIHRALESVVVGEELLADLRAASGSGVFRSAVVREMRARRIGALVVTENGREFELIRRYLPHAAHSLDELTSGLAV